MAICSASSCDPHEVKNTLIANNLACKPLKILTQNICSISANIHNFSTLLHNINTDVDVLILTECWLHKKPAVSNLPGFLSHSSSNPTNQNDGVVVYYNNSITNVSISDPKIIDASSLLIQIQQETVILAIYRPCAYRNPLNFINSLNQTLASLNKFKNIIIAGDININIVPNSNPDQNTEAYLNMLAYNGLLPAHTLPTRKLACLDHVFLKTTCPAQCLVIQSSVSDHDAVLLAIFMKKIAYVS